MNGSSASVLAVHCVPQSVHTTVDPVGVNHELPQDRHATSAGAVVMRHAASCAATGVARCTTRTYRCPGVP